MDYNYYNNYYNKLNSIIKLLDTFPQDNKRDELKNFLCDIYSYLQKGNYLAYMVEEKTSPLERIFSLI